MADMVKYDSNPTGSLSTITDDSVESRLEIVAAVNSATSLNDWCEDNGADAVLDVVNIFTQPGVRKARAAGQADTPCQNTYIITSDGECLMTQSDGIYRSAAVIIAMFPDLTIGEKRGIKIQVKSRKLANGNTIKSLVPVR